MSFWHGLQHHVTAGNVGFVISVILAVWAFAQWRLTGARIWVRMHPGLLGEYTLQHSTADWKNLADSANEGWHREVAVIEVENPGRTPVTVSAVGLDFGRVKRWRLWRHTIVPAYLSYSGNDVTTELKVRLEPFDRAVWIVDPWGQLQPVSTRAGIHHRPVRVRATARVAGVRGRVRSPWRKSWKVEVGQVSFIGPVEPGMAWYRSAERYIGDHDSIDYPMIIEMCLEARKLFPYDKPAPSKDAVEALILKHTYGESPAGASILWSYDMASDLGFLYSVQSASEPPTQNIVVSTPPAASSADPAD